MANSIEEAVNTLLNAQSLPCELYYIQGPDAPTSAPYCVNYVIAGDETQTYFCSKDTGTTAMTFDIYGPDRVILSGIRRAMKTFVKALAGQETGGFRIISVTVDGDSDFPTETNKIFGVSFSATFEWEIFT